LSRASMSPGLDNYFERWCREHVVAAAEAATEPQMLREQPDQVLQLLAAARACVQEHTLNMDISSLPKPSDFPDLNVTGLLLFHSFGASWAIAGHRFSRHGQRELYRKDLMQVVDWCRSYEELTTDFVTRRSFKYYASCCEAWDKLASGSRQFRECVEEAVQGGYWPSAQQRPFPHYTKGLIARPIWSLVRFPRAMQAHLRTVQKQTAMILRETLNVANVHWQDHATLGLFDSGSWMELLVFNTSGMNRTLCAVMPGTCRVLERSILTHMQRVGKEGEGFFLVGKISRIRAGTHVLPHFGTSNTKLRLHLGLHVPTNADGGRCCALRVNESISEWKNGTWIAFDDSFEHEVWNNCTVALEDDAPGWRIVLLVDVPHPGVFAEEGRVDAEL